MVGRPGWLFRSADHQRYRLLHPAPGVTCAANIRPPLLGALVGYNFGPVDLQVWFTDQFVGQDTPAGRGSLDVWTRIGFRLWGPEAPTPLVTKH